MKKNEELLHIIGDVEDKYIESAKPKNIQKKKIAWISAVSAAACLVGTVGLMYYFVVRPLNDINDPGKGSGTITTDVTKTSEPPQTEKNDNELKYPDVKQINMQSIRDACGTEVTDSLDIRNIKSIDDNLFVQEMCESSRENWCLSVGISSLDREIVLPDINNITMNDIYGSDACFNDSYLYILLSRKLISVSLETNEVIAQIGGFHVQMDLSGSTECLGVDTDGNVYLESSDYIDDRYIIRILKYDPQLELVSEYQTSNSIPFEHIINFNDMYIDDNDVLFCVYDDNKSVEIDLSDKTISSEDNIIHDREYWYVDNGSDNSLKTYTNLSEDNRVGNNEVVYIDGLINCIDSDVKLSVNAAIETRFYRLDESGGYLKSYSMLDKPICYGFDINESNEIISAFSKESDGTLTDHIIKYNMVSEKSDMQEIGRNEYSKDSDVISINDFCTDNADNYYFSYMISEKLQGDPSADYPLISRYSKDNYDQQVTVKLTEEDAQDIYFYKTQILIRDNIPYVIAVQKNGQKSIIYKPDFENKTYLKTAEVSGELYPQSDGTILCIADNILYSYSPEDGTRTGIFQLPQEVFMSDIGGVNIQKINENSYAYINGLTDPQETQSKSHLFILTVK